MRIAHLILSDGFAGSERSTIESCNFQCREHEVLLVVRRGHRSRAGASIVDHVDPRVRVAVVPDRLGTRKALARELAMFGPDVVHAHLRRSTRLLAQIRPDAAKFTTLHLRINGPQFLEMDAIVCISPWQPGSIPASFRGEAPYIRNSLVPNRRLSAAEVAALRAELGAAPGDFLVGGVGRLARSKGWDTLVEAFKAAAIPGAKLVILGEGKERGRLERLGGGSVKLPGFKPNVKDYYQAFDLCVVPSRSEPMGRVVLEALDAGVPLIATDAEGPREILKEYPGELVPIGDVAAMRAALERAVAAPRRRVECDLTPHHLETVGPQLVAAYAKVVASRAHAPALVQADLPRRRRKNLDYFLRSAKYAWIRRVERPETLVVEARYCGLRFTTGTTDRHARKLFKHGVHEPPITAWLVEHLRLRPGEVALDVGGNIGWYSMLFDRLAEPGVDIFAFEPDPDNRALLEENIRINAARRVTVVPMAVSDSERAATLHRFSGGNRGQHTLLPLYSGDDVEVRTVTLDGFWESAGLGDRLPRLVKIDIEGHEAAAMRGGQRVLSRCEMLLMEYSPKFMRGANLDPDEPLQLLTAAGLRPNVFVGSRVEPIAIERLRAVEGQANVLWSRAPLGA